MEPAVRDEFQFTVLVVDDDSTILSLMKDIMSMVPGCNIITAGDPLEAMKYVIKGGIDIIFTDIHMPQHSGLEFLQDLISLEQTPEVIVMTAYPNGENAQQAMELGATSFIEKPFKDLEVVENELQKAIKRIIRQRAAEKEVELRKLELSKSQVSQPDNDEVMRVSLPFGDAPVDSVVEGEVQSESINVGAEKPAAALVPKVRQTEPSKLDLDFNAKPERKLFDINLLEPLIEIERERCKRYNRQFALVYIDIPENPQARGEEERSQYRRAQLCKLEKIIRRSDVMMDAGREGIAILAYECNKVGSEVLEAKLMAQGYPHVGFAIHPADGTTPEELKEKARLKVQTKRKFQILVYEPEEFFGRLVQNMLGDPKYHVTWAHSLDETYKTVLDISESIRLMVLSLSKDKEQWKLVAKMLREGLVKWPILLFVDVGVTKEVKTKLGKLGVRAMVNKSASQEEIMYLVQSFVMPKPPGMERKNYRALMALPISYKYDGRNFASNTFTLSKDGLFVRDMNPPPSGQIVDLEIFTPKKIMKTKAEVLYAVPYFVGVNRFHVPGFACKFTDMSESDREELDTMVGNSLTSYLI